MVDFKKHLTATQKNKTLLDPIALYDTLDRASNKGPLRPAQEAVLREWHEHRRGSKDVILKLHTGQGKTLIGLLALQSKLNEGKGPALYLTPNKFLAAQTCEQARDFGVRVVTLEKALLADFTDAKTILVTHIQKLFNGKSVFGLGASAEHVGALVVDDSHACVDTIRQAFVISLRSNKALYGRILDLFAFELEKQGLGTFRDIRNGSYEAVLSVPYWDWLDKISEVTDLLATASGQDSDIKFAWPLLRDILSHCRCVISGTGLEIAPYISDLSAFGSFVNADHRIFMSATVADDSFFVQGLGLSPTTIRNPLIYKDEKWSGEKMILAPSLIDERLDRELLLKHFAPPDSKRTYGVVALTPSFGQAETWRSFGASVSTTDSIDADVTELRNGKFERTVVIANRYDGIDLPDATCRALILDGRPHPESLCDRYVESCRPDSDVVVARVARAIEQGLGRSVRGEKDYCAFVLLGTDLLKHIRSLLKK